MTPPLDKVLVALRNSWGPDTAQNPDPDRGPASGQCAVSSMVIRHYYGGELLRAEMMSLSNYFGAVPSSPTIVHYWNELPGGVWVDSTRDQFEDWWVPSKIVVRPPEYLYAFPDTMERYHILKERVERKLRNNVYIY